MNVHVINDAGQAEMHVTEPLVPELSHFEVEIAIEDCQCGFQHNKLLIRYSIFFRSWRQYSSIMGQCIIYL
jgi:hypothetical protein